MYLRFEFGTNGCREGGKMEIEIIRKIDALGRIVIPKDIRTTLKLAAGDATVISVEKGCIILKKAQVQDN